MVPSGFLFYFFAKLSCTAIETPSAAGEEANKEKNRKSRWQRFLGMKSPPSSCGSFPVFSPKTPRRPSELDRGGHKTEPVLVWNRMEDFCMDPFEIKPGL